MHPMFPCSPGVINQQIFPLVTLLVRSGPDVAGHFQRVSACLDPSVSPNFSGGTLHRVGVLLLVQIDPRWLDWMIYLPS